MTHTRMYGQPVEVTINPGILIMDLLVTLLVMGLTAGLGLPWVYARYRRSFYRSCILPGRGNQTLGFHGSGEEVLGRFLLTLLLLPFSVATGGLMFGVITWMWVKWDYANMLVPRQARPAPPRELQRDVRRLLRPLGARLAPHAGDRGHLPALREDRRMALDGEQHGGAALITGGRGRAGPAPSTAGHTRAGP
jgi:hypothetical protein